MTLKEFFDAKAEWLRNHRHPKTVNETRVAVEAFCEWHGCDPVIDDVTPKMLAEFQQAEKSRRRQQLASNLYGLAAQYDPDSFPRRSKALMTHCRFEATEDAPHLAPGDKPETLVEFARLYVSRRSLSAGYANTLLKRTQKLEAFVGKTSISDLLCEATVNAFLKAIVGTGSPYTVRKYRQDLLTLWSAAADDDLVPYPIRRRIRKDPCEVPAPECYSLDEARALVAAADQLRGAFSCGLPKRIYWPALIRFAWDTGLRRGDCWRFDKGCLQADGSFRVVQSKTRKPIRRQLRPQTVEAINRIDREKPLAWPLGNEWSFGFQFQRIIALAGIERGSFKWLRRATGSHVEAEHPGAGHRALGNTTQVFNSHYNADLAGEVLLPPAL